jgi:pimeloyl-ACP methyl ester carboxylesterase
MKSRIFALLGLSLMILASVSPLALSADDKKPITKKEFEAAFQGPDSTAAGAAVDRLDPDTKEGYELLKTVLGNLGSTWYLRAKAAERLAKTGNDANVKDMISRLSDKSEKNPMVRQGMAIAIAKMGDPKNLPDLHKALADKDGRVRREVAWDLRLKKDVSSITALIDRWKDEKDPIVANFIRDTLEDITQQFLGPKQEGWASWWSEHKDKFKVGESDEDQVRLNEEMKKAEEEGRKLSEGTTRSRDVDLSFVARGKGTPVLVIPEYGMSKDLYIPFFIELEKIAKVCYMDLPKLSSFKNLQAVGQTKIPYYPIDSLVQAFEDFRKEQKVDKFVILSCGIDSWIAMRYATKYPKNVAALVFVAPISSLQEYQKATDRMIKGGEAQGDIELWHCGLERRFNTQTGESQHDEYHRTKQLPKPEGEEVAINRKEFTLYFGDGADTLLDQLYPKAWNHPGECGIPEFKAETETPGPPSLVISGKRSIFTSEDDCARVAKQYGALVANFDRSADFPFIDEPEKFTESVRKFLVKYVGRPKGDKGDKGGDKK